MNNRVESWDRAGDASFSRSMIECAEDMMDLVFREHPENDVVQVFGLTSGQGRVVRTVARLTRNVPEGVALKDLAGSLGLSSGAASIIVYATVLKGALIRQQSEKDRRRVRISLSPECRRLLENAAAELTAITSEIVAGMAGGVPAEVLPFLKEFSRRVSRRSLKAAAVEMR